MLPTSSPALRALGPSGAALSDRPAESGAAGAAARRDLATPAATAASSSLTVPAQTLAESTAAGRGRANAVAAPAALLLPWIMTAPMLLAALLLLLTCVHECVQCWASFD